MAMFDFASRKFLICLIVLLAGIAAMFFGFAKWAEFLELAKWVIGLYLSANVAEKAVDKIRGYVPKEPSEETKP